MRPSQYTWEEKTLSPSRTISYRYPTDDGGAGPQAVWDQHCKNHPSFKGMEYDTTFANRLRAVKNDSTSKMKRAAADKENLEAFRAQHPKQTTNALGEPRWEGSEAQCLLKSDLEEILKLPQEEIDKQLTPKTPHGREDRPAHCVFPLPKFCDHIYQEICRRRFLSHSENKKNKPSKNKVMEERSISLLFVARTVAMLVPEHEACCKIFLFCDTSGVIIFMTRDQRFVSRDPTLVSQDSSRHEFVSPVVTRAKDSCRQLCHQSKIYVAR